MDKLKKLKIIIEIILYIMKIIDAIIKVGKV